MKFSSLSKKSPGFALIALLCCLVIILIVFANVMFWVSTNGEQMRKNIIFTSSEAAAEGGTENIYAHMDRDFVYQTLNAGGATYYAALMPTTNGWPVLYTFSNTVTLGIPETNYLSYLGSEYTNLLGFPQTNTITVTATPIGQTFTIPASVSQTFVFASIPAFQFAIFYNINLEIDPGATMPITGAVFSNGGIWSGTPNVTYASTVEAAGQVNNSSVDPFVSNGSKTGNGGGTPQANYQYTGTPAQPESNVNPLILPIGASSSGTNDNSTNVEAIINLPPAPVCAPQTTAYYKTNLVYDFNAASLIISNWSWGTASVAPWSNNFSVILQDSVPTTPHLESNNIPMNWIQLTNDVYIISNQYHGYAGLWPNNATPMATNHVPGFRFTNNMLAICWTNTVATNGPVGTNYVWYAGFSFLTNVAFYDYREQATVQAVQFDVGKFSAWLWNTSVNGGSNWSSQIIPDLDEGINSAFIYNAVPFIGQQQLPAVRVANGMLLPNSTNVVGGQTYITSGLTLVTPQPMYVLGSYNVQANGSSPLFGSINTANTYPAAFLADSITVLSTNWNDTWSSGTGLTSRNPSSTTINAACLEGIVPSTSTSYCGGVENFLRLLENWNGTTTTLTYNGSIMVMFQSQYATNQWINTGTYYNAPIRNWSFDTNFLIQADLPPLTPYFKAVIRNSWSGY